MNNPVDNIYCDLLQELISDGQEIETRNSKCRRLIAKQFTFTQTPLISTRKTAWKNSLREWEWFMLGSNSILDLHKSARSWWEPWAEKLLGRVWNNYSSQFRMFYGRENRWIDQIEYLIDGIKKHPNSRRNVMTTWNTADMTHPDTPITNCHGTIIQCFVEEGSKLHLVTYQRSVDTVCGLPHNLLQYWAFMVWLAKRGNREPGKLTWIGGDVHLYGGHLDLAKRIRHLGACVKNTPELVYTPTTEEFKADDFTLSGPYEPLLEERAEMYV